jgi:hypothetical protein
MREWSQRRTFSLATNESLAKSLATNEQLYIAVGIPMLFNATLIAFLLAYMNSRFDAINKRFDDMRDLWRAELRRVEEVFDARLKHLEERR